MNFPFFLARRFFFSKSTSKRRRASAPAIHVATAGVAIALAVMIVAVCVVKGFQQEIRSKIAGFGTHMEIFNGGRGGYDVQTSPPRLVAMLPPEDFPIFASDSLLQQLRQTPGVVHVQPTTLKMGILKTHDSFKSFELKGVGEDYNSSFMRSSLVAGQWPRLGSYSASNRLVISKRMSDELQLQVGQKVNAYFFEETIKTRRFTVAAIYETHLAQFDDYFAFTDIFTVSQLNEYAVGECNEIELLTTGIEEAAGVKASLSWLRQLPCDTASRPYDLATIRENPASRGTFQWIDLLDFNVWLILCIMLSVAVFTMVSGLLILILERVSTIGLLKALGATSSRVASVFLHFSALIIVRGLVIGNVLGLGLVVAQREFGLLHLDPASYYVDRAPVEISWPWIVGLNLATLFLTLLVLLLPALIVSRIQPARAIRFD